MKTLTRTVRLVVGVAAMLAITAQVAQARPYVASGSSGTTVFPGTITASARATDLIMPSQPPITASARATDLIMRPQTSTPVAVGVTPVPDRVDRIGTDLVRTPVLPTGVVHASDPGFDWNAAMAGAGSVLASMLLAGVAVTARGRRRIAVSN